MPTRITAPFRQSRTKLCLYYDFVVTYSPNQKTKTTPTDTLLINTSRQQQIGPIIQFILIIIINV